MLEEIRSFKLVICWFTPVFAALDRCRFITRWTALMVFLSLSGSFQSSVQWIGKVFYRWYQSLILEVFFVNLGVSPPASTSVELCHNLFHNLNKWGWCFFFTSTVQCRNMWNGNTWWNSTCISRVKYILGQYVSGPVWIYHAVVRSFFTIFTRAT